MSVSLESSVVYRMLHRCSLSSQRSPKKGIAAADAISVDSARGDQLDFLAGAIDLEVSNDGGWAQTIQPVWHCD